MRYTEILSAKPAHIEKSLKTVYSNIFLLSEVRRNVTVRRDNIWR